METAMIVKVAVSAAPYSIDRPYDYLVPETLENILRNELIPQNEPETDKRKLNIPEWLRARKDGVDEHE